MKDLVVIVFLNYNQNKYTLDCIDSILASNYENYKILLIDNGSTKENVELLMNDLPKDERLIFKRIEDNIGYVRGTNFGYQEGAKLNPNYLMVMNNDTILDKNAINEFVQTCKNFNNKALVTGKVYHYDEPEKLQFVGYKYRNEKLLTFDRIGLDELDNNQYDKITERDMIDDIFALFPIELYNKIGGYTPYLWFSGENVDFALRAKKEGYKLVYTPFAKLWHKGSVSMGGREMNAKLAYWTIQSSLILRYRHLKKSQFFLFYLTTLQSVFRTLIKSVYLKMFKSKDISKYASAKYKGLLYFNKWVFKKNINTGENPFS